MNDRSIMEILADMKPLIESVTGEKLRDLPTLEPITVMPRIIELGEDAPVRQSTTSGAI